MVEISKIINYIIDFYIKFIYAIGYFSAIIVSLIILCVLYKQPFDLLFYVIGFTINNIINKYLKLVIKEERPNDPIKFFNNNYLNKNIASYGMPSGHSQNIFFSTAYFYLSTDKFVPWVLLCFIISIITVYQRWHFQNHTILQLIIGGILGIISAYVIVLIRNYIKNKI